MKKTRKYWIVGVVLLCVVSMLLMRVVWTSLRLLPRSGWIVGYHRRGDLVRISLLTGEMHQLLPRDIETDHRLAAPAIAFRTPTIYYVDRTTGTLMAYTKGADTPKTLHAWPMEPSPVKESSIPFSRIVNNIEWLLLSPDEEALYFNEIENTSAKQSHLIEYTLRTGNYRVVATSRLYSSPPAVWLDASRLLIDADGKLATVDIQTGRLTNLLELRGLRALSPDQTRLLIIRQKRPDVEFVLYEFPSLRLLKRTSIDLLVTYDGIREPFCFVDNERILLGLRKDWVIAEMLTSIHLFDVRTMNHRRVATYLDDLFYVLKWPDEQRP